MADWKVHYVFYFFESVAINKLTDKNNYYTF